MSSNRITEGRFLHVFSWQDICFSTIALVVLNAIDVILTFYAVNILGFVELNPLVVGFPVWIFFLKFSVCFIPVFCAYILDKYRMQNYLLLPFVFSVLLIQFYCFVVVFGMCYILM